MATTNAVKKTTATTPAKKTTTATSSSSASSVLTQAASSSPAVQSAAASQKQTAAAGQAAANAGTGIFNWQLPNIMPSLDQFLGLPTVIDYQDIGIRVAMVVTGIILVLLVGWAFVNGKQTTNVAVQAPANTSAQPAKEAEEAEEAAEVGA